MQNYPTCEQIAEMTRLLTQARIENWLGEGVGSWRWWVLVLLMFVPWFIWAKLVDKKRIHELALFGMFIMVDAITLDELGFVLSLWDYPVSKAHFSRLYGAANCLYVAISVLSQLEEFLLVISYAVRYFFIRGRTHYCKAGILCAY